MTTFRQHIARPALTVAPLVLDPMSAKLAQIAGFHALYLGGGALGYLKAVTEATLSVTEMAQLGLDIRTTCDLPLILDGACGWGEPMHLVRTVALAQAAGFAAIEIEDQIVPKRAHHHVGIEHLIPLDQMVDKVAVAVEARTNPEFIIIARTNAGRHDIDEAVRRGEAMRRAGADMLLVFATHAEHLRYIGERLQGPLVHMIAPGKGFMDLGMSPEDLVGLGYRLMIDSMSPLLRVHSALRQSYAAIARGFGDPAVSFDDFDAVHDTIGLQRLLAIELRTVERSSKAGTVSNGLPFGSSS